MMLFKVALGLALAGLALVSGALVVVVAAQPGAVLRPSTVAANTCEMLGGGLLARVHSCPIIR